MLLDKAAAEIQPEKPSGAPLLRGPEVVPERSKRRAKVVLFFFFFFFLFSFFFFLFFFFFSPLLR